MLKHGMKIIRAAVILFFAVAIAYLLYQIILALNTGYRTVLAVAYIEIEGADVSGMMVFDETVIRNPGAEPYALLVEQGERVSKNQAIASVFASEEEVERFYGLRRIDQKIGLLGFYERSARSTSELSVINKNITESIRLLAENSAEGRYTDMKSDMESLYRNIYLRTVSLSGTQPLSEMKRKLSDTGRSLGTVKAKKTYKSGTAGYYSTAVDGFEGILSPDLVRDMSTEEFTELSGLQPEVPDKFTVVGKLITSSDWGFATLADTETAKKLSVGKTYTLQISGSEIPASLKWAGSDFEGKTLLYFQSSYNITAVSPMRRRSATIELNRFEGFKVPKTALRIQDGEAGVFVIEGTTVEFKKVGILLEQENYYIVSSEGSGSLKIYDEIILNNKGVYDGMIVKNN